MLRLARIVLIASLLMLSVSVVAVPGQSASAQVRSQAQLHIVLQLAPLVGSGSFTGGLIDMLFSGVERDWNSAAGIVDLSIANDERLPDTTQFLGGLSWSTSASTLPVPPDDVTFSMFAENGQPYRVMLTATSDTSFAVLSQSTDKATLVVHGTIHLHVSIGSHLAVDELVQVRGHAVYSQANSPVAGNA